LIPVAAAVVLVGATDSLTVKMRDDCDPKTFNAAVGPGTCVGHGGTKFEDFVAELAKKGSVKDWAFNPDNHDVEHGSTVTLENRGGETHTFTKVAMFGPGFVPQLNPPGAIPLPECLNMLSSPPSPSAQFVGPGMTVKGPVAGSPDLPKGKTVKIQCCIHPWMHTEITVR
jgi:plastocyanin